MDCLWYSKSPSCLAMRSELLLNRKRDPYPSPAAINGADAPIADAAPSSPPAMYPNAPGIDAPATVALVKLAPSVRTRPTPLLSNTLAVPRTRDGISRDCVRIGFSWDVASPSTRFSVLSTITSESFGLSAGNAPTLLKNGKLLSAMVNCLPSIAVLLPIVANARGPM